MTLDELRNLQPSDIVRWPLKTKIIAGFILFLVLGVIAWFEFISPELSMYTSDQHQITVLKNKVRTKQLLAAALPAYQHQIKEMDAGFQKFLRQLPNRSQIPSLLDSVTAAGKNDGLQFELFQPKAEVNKNFYVEIPVQLKVTGRYSSLGNFAANVAAMPRIVTMDNVQIHRVKNTGKTLAQKAEDHQKLEMQCVVTTYRYQKNKRSKAK